MFILFFKETVLEKTFPLSEEPASSNAISLNLESGHNILADSLAHYAKWEYGVVIETVSI